MPVHHAGWHLPLTSAATQQPMHALIGFSNVQSCQCPCFGLQEDQSLLRQLEATAEEALGGRNWMARLDPDFLENLGRYRKYRPASLRDLLRVVRNKHNHFRELPDGLRAKLGPLPDGFLRCAMSSSACQCQGLESTLLARGCRLSARGPTWVLGRASGSA